jgi:hypothetical protein
MASDIMKKNLKSILMAMIISLLLASCAREKKKAPLPPDILTEEQFATVLSDFALAESASNLNIQKAALHQMDSVYAFDPLLENGVRKSQYDSSLKFYIAHPERYREVYEIALVKLSEMESARATAKKDSTVK